MDITDILLGVVILLLIGVFVSFIIFKKDWLGFLLTGWVFIVSALQNIVGAYTEIPMVFINLLAAAALFVRAFFSWRKQSAIRQKDASR